MAAVKKGYTRLKFHGNVSYGFPLDSEHRPAEKVVVDGIERTASASEQFEIGQVVDVPDSDAEVLLATGECVEVNAKGDEVEPEPDDAA